MKIFIVGLPKSGRTTVAQALAKELECHYVDAATWLAHSFRAQNPGEHHQQYKEEYKAFMVEKLSEYPNLVVDRIDDLIGNCWHPENFIIDGIQSPRDFVSLFDYTKDLVVFLNRTDNEYEYEDYENIGISVMRDYCFWLSSASLLPKERWLEFNFKVPGEESDYIKTLGSKNTVHIVKSLNKVISHLKEVIPQSHSFQNP